MIYMGISGNFPSSICGLDHSGSGPNIILLVRMQHIKKKHAGMQCYIDESRLQFIGIGQFSKSLGILVPWTNMYTPTDCNRTMRVPLAIDMFKNSANTALGSGKSAVT